MKICGPSSTFQTAFNDLARSAYVRTCICCQ